MCDKCGKYEESNDVYVVECPSFWSKLVRKKFIKDMGELITPDIPKNLEDKTRN